MLTVVPRGKRPLGRPRCIWEDNITMDFREIGINTRNWVDLAQDRNYWRALVNAALKLCVSQAEELDIHFTTQNLHLSFSQKLFGAICTI